MKFSTNFKEVFIPKINNIFKFVLENPYSDFYRNKYRGLNLGKIKTYEDFQKIPFLEKEEFAALPIDMRTFIPKKDVGMYSFSSGTTGSGKPTIIPRKRVGFSTVREKELIKMGVKNYLALMPAGSMGLLSLLKTKTEQVVIIPADVTKLQLSAQIAKEVVVQAIFSTPTILYYFIKNLEKVGFDLKSLKYISLGSEFCTNQKYNFLKSKLPNAFFEFRYFNSIVDPRGRGHRCDHLAKEVPSVFHPSQESLTEIVKDNNVAPTGEIGEIIQTHLSPGAFPLIRYKTGDMGSLSKTACPCGNEYMLTLGGKESFDVLRFSGVTLTSENISQALEGLENFIEPSFQAHIFEETHKDKILHKLELHLSPKSEIKEKRDDLYWKDILANKISPNLKLSARNTLKDLIDKNVFLPLEIVWVEENKKDAKSKNIISHLN
ncbi:hypothetical protein C0584_02670 [Candidatus Parcubacteria bacterium]|nr:MAG: hypothetical protein C0584_02670 [Candidatus Parcubacteria bacterium]